MIFEHDFYKHLSPPPFILCKANWDRVGIINCTEKKAIFKYNDLDEITFTTYRYTDGLLNETYDQISDMKYIFVPDIGKYIISRVQTVSEGMKYEYKECAAIGIQSLLAQKSLDTFTINMGTTESIDGVKLFNPNNIEKSLLHLALEKFPDWSIGHVSTELMTQERSFEISVKDVYGFLTTDVATAFECIFIFDTLNMIINVYKESEYGSDTNISVSYNNLLEQTSITSSVDDIKTCLSLTGYDNLNVREVNMGFDKIYNFDYYNSLEYFSQSLYTSFNKWKTKYDSQLPSYNNLLSQYQKYYEDLYYWEHEKMPDDPDSTDWTLYGLVPLQEKMEKYELLESTYMKAGWGETSNANYSTKYLPNHNIIQNIKARISVVENQIASIKSKQNNIGNQMNSIIDAVSMERNFSKENLEELSKYIREQDLSTQNYTVTDSMTNSERIDMLNEFLSYGKKELAKISQPQFNFSIDMVNLFAIPEFDDISMDFDPGNYIHITLRDDYMVKARLLSVSIDFFDTTNFSVTFGNVSKIKGKNIYSDLTEAANEAKSVATSVSFNSSYWNKNSKKADDATKMLSEGLIAAGAYLKSGDDSELVIDKRGIFVNTTTGVYSGKDSIFIGGGRILFTDDNWKTVAEAIGRVDIHGQSTFGVLAKAMIAGYISASEIEASTMKASTVIGTSINNGNGTFSVDANGNLVANSATITGDITANTGYIGGTKGFVIKEGKLYSGKSELSSSTAGVYIGTNGISLGSGNTFSVDANGNLVAKSGTFGGIKIAANKIYSGNGNFQITDAGYAQFKNVYITGVESGSNFGGIEYNGGTYGYLDKGFWAGSKFGLGGGALSNFNELVANKVTANYIDVTVGLSANYATIKELHTEYITANSIAATYATINELHTKYFTADHIISNFITAETVKAKYATIEALKAKRLSVKNLDSDTVNGYSVGWREENIITNISKNYLKVATADGGTANVLYDISWTRYPIYILAGRG